MNKRYITTSIAYVNAEPHIGFLYELLAADVLKRYHQSLGEEVFFVTGTDEHGIKVAQAAISAGKSEQEYVDEVSGKFEALGKDFNIGWEYFIRTTNPDHIKFVQEKWRQLEKSGVLKKKKYTGLYCSGCEAFKTGDEIQDNKCTIHEKDLELVEEENWFFNTSKFKSQISKWIEKHVFPVTRRQEVINILESGAYDEISLSRSKERYGWGVPVPGDEGQIMYVWVDALFNYISALKINRKEDLWPADIQIIGKDILKFHAIIWPALLLACGYTEDKLPKKLLVHGFINVDGKKMSKSLGNVITPAQLKERYGVEATRYLLFRQLSFYDDSNFTWEDFDRVYNGDLANGLGNLLARVVTLAKKFEASGAAQAAFESLDDIDELNPGLGEHNFHGAAVNILEQVNQADRDITTQKPWEWKDVSNEKRARLIAISRLPEIEKLLKPFMPETAKEIRRQLTELDSKPLFPRLEK